MRHIILCFFYILSILLLIISVVCSYPDAVLFSALCILLHNLLFSLFKLRQRIVFLFFNLMVQFFLLDRPLINLLNGYSVGIYGVKNELFVLAMISLSLHFLYWGAALGDRFVVRYTKRSPIALIEKNTHWHSSYIQTVSIILFYFFITFTLILDVEKIMFRLSHSYIEYYSDFSSRLPHIFTVFSVFTDYMLCFYLATYPSKKKTLFPLMLYVGSAIPELIVGQRNPIMLRLVFSVVYFILRDFTSYKTKWFGSFEKAGGLLGLPAVLILMAFIGQVRNTAVFLFQSINSILTNLLYDQGITYMWVANSFDVLSKLDNKISYTFGGFIDYFLYGGIARRFFGAVSLGDGNSIRYATESNNLAHHLSYVLLGPDRYLAGEGTGSCFLLELYLDFGFIGIIIFSAILGFLMIYVVKFMQKTVFRYAVVLICLRNLFFVPRAEALGFLTFIISPYFWLSSVTCVCGSLLLYRRYHRFRQHTQLHSSE